MKKFNEYIKVNYDELLEIAKRICNYIYPDYEDLLHETFLELYKVNDKKLEEIIDRKELKYYIIRIFSNLYYRKDSKFNNKYKRIYLIQRELQKNAKRNINHYLDILNKNNVEYWEEVNKKVTWIENKLKDIDWFDAQVFKIYYLEKHSLNTMSKATNINRSTLGKSIRKVKKYLKNEIKK